ncbi:unnamed protein product [Urochloa decumbens]|uniref:DUF295 domain-containing protein n=1 Tax=Urochloa decumbens TaxID=240449 RepID=A0ABC9B927_9POAL
MAEPPPPLPPTTLEDLPVDLQRLILIRIPCAVDRGRMSLVCRAWRDAIRRHRAKLVGRLFQQPPPLSWLLLRAPSPLGLALGPARAACALSGGRVHHFLDVAPPHARFFGSHDGAWLLLDAAANPRNADASAHRAVNVRTGAVRDFPQEVALGPTEEYVRRMLIHAAALSSSPDDARCVGYAIVTSFRNPTIFLPDRQRRRGIALWVAGSPQAINVEPPFQGVGDVDAEDVIYLRHSGAFAFVTRAGHLRLSKPVWRQHNSPRGAKWLTRRFRPHVGPDVRTRYLVVSGGELLMVVRFMPHPDHQPASKFKVFRVIERNSADADANDFPVAEYPWAWSELDTLGGRMLFVGHGCSRSYKVDEYPGFEAGIYFLDDGIFYADSVIFGIGDARRYPCSDNGKWTEDGHVQRCFPRSGPSHHSAPVWLLP